MRSILAHTRDVWQSFLDRMFPYRRRRPFGKPYLCLEVLEDRLAPANLVVVDLQDAVQLNAGTNSALDTNGLVSLRSAVAAANVDAQNGISDSITFDSSLSGKTVVLTQVLELTGAVGATITIDGGGQVT